MSELPEWPDRPPSMGVLLSRPHDVQPAHHELDCRLEFQVRTIEYERARADAAMARLRVAVAKLKEAREDIDNWAGYASEYFVEKHDLAGCLRSYEETLASIGELPPE